MFLWGKLTIMGLKIKMLKRYYTIKETEMSGGVVTDAKIHSISQENQLFRCKWARSKAGKN
jgi:stalled ribosome alternative rescue factor ArfA